MKNICWVIILLFSIKSDLVAQEREIAHAGSYVVSNDIRQGQRMLAKLIVQYGDDWQRIIPAFKNIYPPHKYKKLYGKYGEIRDEVVSGAQALSGHN